MSLRRSLREVTEDERLELGWFKNARGLWCSPECRGVHVYQTTERCFRDGALQPTGTVLVLEDEIPSRTWVKVTGRVETFAIRAFWRKRGR